MAPARANERQAAEPEGLLVLDKPAGISSHQAVQRVKKVLGARKAGHLGTLDPMASGVLLVCVGPATKAAPFVADHEKEYEATAFLGAETDTWDAEGEIVFRCDVSEVDRKAVREVLESLRGEMELEAPPFSAIKKDGKPLYKRARRGEKTETLMRRANVVEMETLDIRPPRVTFRCVVSRGTYVRSIVREMGRKLGVGAYLEKLRRTRSGNFGIEDAIDLEMLEDLRRHGRIFEKLLNSSDVLGQMPELSLNSVESSKVRNGERLMRGQLPGNALKTLDFGRGTLFRATDPQGRLLAVMELERQEGECACFKPVRVWRR